LLLIFAVTLFVSALLVFLVQPMVGKMILPGLGGTPAVWNTCMVFFQAALLAGYAYAHASVRLLGVRKQAGMHLALLLAPLAVLPVAVSMSGVPSSADNPMFWLLGRLALGVGLPFFVVSTTAPLLQYWFSHTGHKDARDPYFLYGASNVGSLLALVGYPTVLERVWDLESQARWWSVGYGVLVGLIVLCAIILWTRPRHGHPVEAATGEFVAGGDSPSSRPSLEGKGVSWVRRARWVFLAFVPSSLMLGVTTHITTDLAPVPLLWVVPLALYLLTFVIVFARRPIIPHAMVVRVTPFVLAPVAVMTLQGETALGWMPVPLHLVMFFLAALLCHGELVADRPATSYLTEFYLWMSVGGVIGGIFNAIVAPLAFNTILEYPLVMLAVFLAVRGRGVPAGVTRWAIPAVLAVACVAGTWGLLKVVHPDFWRDGWPRTLTILIPAGFCVLWRRHPRWFAFSLAGVVAGSALGAPTRQEQTLYLGRNFFGMKRVTLDRSGFYHSFLHGRTIHGIQDVRRPGVALAYFHRSGPMGEVFATYRQSRSPRRVAIIGLGAGSQAVYAEARDTFDLYEIDPEVARIAMTRELFTFVPDCAGKTEIILGDGRIRLGEMPDGAYGLIALDAFSSDAVPTHLLTREALALYLGKLDDRGMLVFNISNRYFDLAPLLAALAKEAGLTCYVRADLNLSPQEESIGKIGSRFLVMARRYEHLRPLVFDDRWSEYPGDSKFPVWTDQYSSIFSVIEW